MGYDANDLEVFENEGGAVICIEEFCLDMKDTNCLEIKKSSNSVSSIGDNQNCLFDGQIIPINTIK